MKTFLLSVLVASAGCMMDESPDHGLATEEIHSWGNYHWAATGPFTLRLGDNVTGPWDSVLATTSSDWSRSSVLDTTIVPGTATTKKCRASSGRVEVCNNTYGRNGWLGIAQIWASGSHITQAVVKLNDTYFNQAPYNTTAWRNLVSCQEVGHAFGLDHQDENFDNAPLGTCMDYSNDPQPNQHPNAHDYEQLELIYDHDDGTTTVAQDLVAAAASAPANFGTLVHASRDGRQHVYVHELGGGSRIVTFVTWAE